MPNQREWLVEFIEIDLSEPCLWKVKAKEYHDRGNKDAAYGKLLTKLQEIEPTSDKESDMASVQAEQAYSGQVPRTASCATLPPSYDALISSTSAKPQPSSSEPPPPTYDEAMYLIDDGKYSLEIKGTNSTKSDTSEQTSSNNDVSKP